MIHIIIFSYNRAMQLSALLDSLLDKWHGCKYQLDVIYNYSDKIYDDGYDIIIDKYRDNNIHFHPEVKEHGNDSFISKIKPSRSSFRSIIVELLNNTNCQNVMFLTDDSLFVKNVDITDSVLDWVNEDPHGRQFSLKMGKDNGQVPDRVHCDERYCFWNVYNSNPGAWGQAFSINAVVYNKQFLLSLVQKVHFSDISSFVSSLSELVKKYRYFEQAKCELEIKVINISINVVRKTNKKIHQDVSPLLLNEHFINGDRIEYDLNYQYDPSIQYINNLYFVSKDGQSTNYHVRGKIKTDSQINNISLLLSSCDKYEDTWKSFFQQLIKNWPEFSMPVFLGTETKRFSFPGLEIRCPLADDKTYTQWSERLIQLLKYIETDYVLFMLDDFWLTKPVDSIVLGRILGYMKDNSRIGFICLLNEQDTGAEECEYSELRESLKNKPYRITTQAGIWRKDYLLKILKSHESAWAFETRATWRSRLYKERVFDCKFNYFCYPIGGTIGGGKLYRSYLSLYDKEIVQPCYHRGFVDLGEKRDYPIKKRNFSYYWDKVKSALP